ncbi:MFS transporter [Chloroflexota bacterium]
MSYNSDAIFPMASHGLVRSATAMIEDKQEVYRYRWVILVAVWLAYTMLWAQRLSIPPLAPFLQEDLHLTHAQIGLFMTAAGAGVWLTLLPSGWLTDRFGVRPILLGGQVLGGISLLAMSLIHSPLMGFVLMGLVGFFVGALTPATTKAVMYWFPVRERATVMGFKQTGVNIGGILMAATLPALALATGWRTAILIVGAIAITFGVLAFILYREFPQQASASETASGSNRERLRWSAVREVLTRNILCLSFGCLFLSLIEFGLMTHLVVYLKEAIVLPVVVAGLGLAVVEGGGAFGKPLNGFISDFFFRGRRKSTLILIAVIACALCLVVAFLAKSFSLWLLLPVFAVLGFVTIGWGGLWLTMVGEFSGRERTGIATGLSTMIVVGGSMVGPPIFGLIVDITDSYRLAWVFLAICAAISAILLTAVSEKKKAQ